ncbi:MAG: hypothetical protein P4K83_01750 [Terracidiphilus sp.]|nr:hypothetical protein [Terracidiphilus sp.]
MSLWQRCRHWIKHTVGVDRAIFYTVLARGWGSLAGLLTIALIAHYLTPAEQGYYYTFGSLVALQIVFELGFSFVILQMASHEVAHLSISSNEEISGTREAHGRLASVLKLTVKWYSIASMLMVLALIPSGIYFFSTQQKGANNVNWLGPWCLDVVAASMTFLLDPILSFMEGCGYVSEISRLRLMQSVTGSVVAWTVLIANEGLYAPAMIMIGTVVATIIWLYGKRKIIFELLKHDTGENRVSWSREVWPFQWKIAISWLCGYFIFQLFNPVLFAFQGPAAAGQMGMSLTIASAMQAVAISWINTKRAPFGTLIALKEYRKLDNIFFKTLRQSMTVCVFGGVAICSGVIVANHFHHPFARRLLEPLPFSLLLFATTINVAVGSMALYLRAHKEEKFLWQSIINGVLIGLSTYFMGRYYGATAVVAGYLLIGIVFGLGLGIFIFQKYRRLWHEPQETAFDNCDSNI